MKNTLQKLTQYFKKEQAQVNEPTHPTFLEIQREYFRLALTSPLVATLNIQQLNGKPVQANSTKVLIDDIGPGGLRFLSELHFPTHHQFLLSFKTLILGETVEMSGPIRWAKEQDGLFSYGIQYDIEELDRKDLSKVLNKFMLSLKNEGIYPKSQLYKEERTRFFQNR